MPRGMSSCGHCGSQVPSYYKKYHQRMCLRRRLQAGEISEAEYLMRKGRITKAKMKELSDLKQKTLRIWQKEENQAAKI